jgi:hypothetical protein
LLVVLGLLGQLLHSRCHARKGCRAGDKQQLLSNVLNDRGEEDGRGPGHKSSLVVFVWVHAEAALLLDIAVLVLILELAQARVNHDAQAGALPHLLYVPPVCGLGLLCGELVDVVSGQQALEFLVSGLNGVAGQSRLEHIGHGGADGSQ